MKVMKNDKMYIDKLVIELIQIKLELKIKIKLI